MRNVIQLCLAANNVLLMCKWHHAFSCCDRSYVKMADCFAYRRYSFKTRWWNDKTINELAYRKISWFVSVSQINYLPKPTTDKSRYFAQPRPIIFICFIFLWTKVCKNFCDNNITVTEQENYGFDNCVTFMTGSYLQPRGQYAQVVFGIVEKADVKPMQYSRRLSLDSNGEDGIHNFKTV